MVRDPGACESVKACVSTDPEPASAEAVASLLAQAGLEGEPRLFPVVGGANNRVFRVDVGDRVALLKVYFRHPDDPRDRLGTEFGFCAFAWKQGVRGLPRPLACDRDRNMALYEWVCGERLLPEQVSESAVQQVVDFYRELNLHRDTPEARALPEASEACFSVAEHLTCVEGRLRRLLALGEAPQDAPGDGDQEAEPEGAALVAEAAAFVLEELIAAWRRVVAVVREGSRRLGLSPHAVLREADRRLSPSDFGFHNALLAPDGHLRFIDFEYAGWDDPAKMVCDLFCQPALPVPMGQYEGFATAVAEDLSEPELQLQRFRMLLPVHGIKWCCILLNDFLPAGGARRRFAGGGVLPLESKARQLEKARQALRTLQENTDRPGDRPS